MRAQKAWRPAVTISRIAARARRREIGKGRQKHEARSQSLATSVGTLFDFSISKV